VAAPPQRRSRAEAQAETRRRLLEAAAQVIRERGFGAASVEAIAAAAGFTRGAFYSNFETKEQLFVELLHERVYDGYRRMGETLPREGTPLERLLWAAEQLAERQRDDDYRWLFELWLELLAQAARDREFARVAATFWTGNRAMTASLIEAGYAETGRQPPIDAKDLATAQIAMDIGLAVQHLVDPEAVPLELYPKLWGLLFGSLISPSPGGE